MSLGVKRTIEKTITCKGFEIKDEMKKRFEKKTEVHDDLVSKLEGSLSKDGYKCSKEMEIEIVWRNERLRGKIDLLCEKGDKLYLFEVKSYPSSKAKVPFETLQTIAYAKMVKEKWRKDVIPVLVFKINDKLVEVAVLGEGDLNVSVEEVPLEDLAPGPWCPLCIHFREGLCTYNSK